MDNCRQACPYNTLDGCKVKEYNAICPLTNMATPVTEYRMTNADRIRAMSDEELAGFLECEDWLCDAYNLCSECPMKGEGGKCLSVLEWLKQPAEE